MLILLRGAAAEHLWHFELGQELEPEPGVVALLRWVLADYMTRYEEQYRVPGGSALAVLLPWLAAATTDEQRRDILTAIGLYFEDSPQKHLVPWLDHPSPVVGAAATRAIGRLGLDANVARLGRMLDDPDGGVRVQAVRALALSEKASAIPLLDAAVIKDPNLAPDVSAALDVLAEGVRGNNLGSMVRLLAGSEYDDATRYALWTDDVALKVLEERSHPRYVRARAARALGLGRGPLAATQLRAFVEDDAEDVEVRAASIVALGRAGSSAASRYFLPLLDHPEARIQEAAVTATGLSRDARQVAPLLSLWDARGGGLRLEVKTALRRLATAAGRRALTSRPQWIFPADPAWYVITDTLEVHRTFRRDLILPHLASVDEQARGDAAVLLAYFGDATDKARLEVLYLGDPSEEVRWIAAIGVREMERRGL